MLKISGIIPNTARVASTDLSDAHPVRPGVPTFGRPVGRSQSGDFNVRTELPMMDIRTARELEHSQIVNNITNDFFMNKKRDVAEPIGIGNIGIKEVNTNPVGAPVVEQQYAAESNTVEDPEYLRHGRYLDVEV